MYPRPQSAKAVLAMRRLPQRHVAAKYGCSPTYVGRVVNGFVPPSVAFRRFLVEFLDLPEDQLFRDEQRADEGAVA